MLQYFRQLDRLLRGEATSASALRLGTILISTDRIALAVLVLAALYGVCMGVFSLVNGTDAYVQRMLATMIKVPALFFMTLLITFPSLYVFNALIGSRLHLGDVLRLLLASLGIIVAVLASFGPIVAFFSVSTTSYPFMLLLNVAVFAIAGLLGVRFMMRTLERVSFASESKEEDEDESVKDGSITDDSFAVPVGIDEFRAAVSGGKSPHGALDREDGRTADPKVRTVFRIWIVVFGLVGAQMGWVLRPFLGDPSLPFQWLRGRESSFFESVGRAVLNLIAS